MDLSALVSALNTAIQQASDDKLTKQADIDAKNQTITDLESAIKDDQGEQGECDAIVAGAQKFLAALAPYLPVTPVP
jgi:hypothetical protein